MFRRAQSESEPAYTEDRTLRGPSSTSRSGSCFLTMISIQAELKISYRHIQSLKIAYDLLQICFPRWHRPHHILRITEKGAQYYHSLKVTRHVERNISYQKQERRLSPFVMKRASRAFLGKSSFPPSSSNPTILSIATPFLHITFSRKMSVCSKPLASYIFYKNPHTSGVLKRGTTIQSTNLGSTM